MKKLLYLNLACLIVMVSANLVVAQISQIRVPRSFEIIDKSKTNIVPFRTMRTVDVEKLRKEDIINDQYKDIPWRFGDNIDVNYNIYASGVWDELPDGSKLWRLGIKSSGALSINLLFSQYKLPKGAELYIYSPDYKQQLGAFTDFNNQADGLFATTLILTDNIIIEYYEPAKADFRGELVLSRVTHGYRGVGDFIKAFGESGSCNVNVACPQSACREEQIRSVAMLVTNGSGFCTGALINNTSNNGTPYFLSANHCFSNPGSVVFWFNWQSATCANPSSSPAYNSLSGAVTRARYAVSDMWLLQLNNAVPESFNPFFAGWNRTLENNIAGTVFGVHHPSADIKKLSWSTLGASTTTRGQNSVPGDGSHWRITSWSDGTTTEGGSSGSPLFDPNGRIIGQLYGGWAACGNTLSDWYGKLGISWTGGATDATRLRNWLDPINSGATTLNGYDPYAITYNISGPATVCTSNSTFTLDNFPSGASVNWTHSNNLSYVSGQGTLNYTVSAISNSIVVPDIITATISNVSCQDVIIQKEVYSSPDFSNFEIQVPVSPINGNYDFVVWASGLPAQITNYNWTVSNGYIVSQELNEIIIHPTSCTLDPRQRPVTINVTANNSCGSASAYTFVPVHCDEGAINPLSVQPNPANNYIDAEIIDIDPEIDNNKLQIKLFNNNSIPVYTGNSHQKSFRINTSHLPHGLYILQVIYNGKKYSKQILVEH